jgi:bis(5'-adenosyl)-triphosphatase
MRRCFLVGLGVVCTRGAVVAPVRGARIGSAKCASTPWLWVPQQATRSPATMSSKNGMDESRTERDSDSDVMFGRFRISSDCTFYRSSLSTIAFVNLRPIVPGHVLVMPRRIVPTLSEMTDEEYVDLWQSVRQVQAMLTQYFGSGQPSRIAFNVAVQDGAAAGQSVPHVHVHILPRFSGDLERNDDIYDALQEWAPSQLKNPQHGSSKDTSSTKLHVPEDSERRDRTREEMVQEAVAYRAVFDRMQAPPR